MLVVLVEVWLDDIIEGGVLVVREGVISLFTKDYALYWLVVTKVVRYTVSVCECVNQSVFCQALESAPSLTSLFRPPARLPGLSKTYHAQTHTQRHTCNLFIQAKDLCFHITHIL